MRYLLALSLLLNLCCLSCLPVRSGEPGPPSASATASAGTSPLPAASASATAKASPSPLPVLRIRDASLAIELACTPAEQQRGLMYRRELAADQGMLFVFPREQALSFWMRNTYVPLSIAYLDASGRIVDIEDMTPLDESPHPSAKPARYALEVNQGWFSRHGVVVGDLIKLDSFCSHP